jgi:hypothetical protein
MILAQIVLHFNHSTNFAIYNLLCKAYSLLLLSFLDIIHSVIKYVLCLYSQVL